MHLYTQRSLNNYVPNPGFLGLPSGLFYELLTWSRIPTRRGRRGTTLFNADPLGFGVQDPDLGLSSTHRYRRNIRIYHRFSVLRNALHLVRYHFQIQRGLWGTLSGKKYSPF